MARVAAAVVRIGPDTSASTSADCGSVQSTKGSPVTPWDQLGEELGPARDLVAEYVLRRKNERPESGLVPVTFRWHHQKFKPPEVVQTIQLVPDSEA